MAIYVYCTEECREEARKHSVEENLNRLIDKVESDQSFSQFQHYPAPFYVKKKFGMFIGRLIAQREEVDGDVVLVLLSFMTRGSKEYKDKGGFHNDPVKYAQQHFAERFTKEALQSHVAEKRKSPPVSRKPNLEPSEQLILDSALSASATPPQSFAESSVWVSQASKDEVRNRRQAVGGMVYDLSSDWQASAADAVPGGQKQQLKGDSGFVIWSRLFPEHGIRLLAYVGRASEADKAVDSSLLSVMNAAAPTKEDILKVSSRLYPDFVCAGFDLWARLQDDHDSNLALSPEEEEVRRSVRLKKDHGRTNVGYPLFINGRAGSGKTTILHYLFAEYAVYHAKSGNTVDTGYAPMYFTANPMLKERAAENVAKIAISNANINSAASDVDAAEAERYKAVISNYFSCFHEFLLRSLPQGLAGRYPASKRITYPRFRELWEKKFMADTMTRQKAPPAISWHVIRSYILGSETDFDDFDVDLERTETAHNIMEPDDYIQLEKKQKSVSEETFRVVYDRVWNWYAELKRDEGYWDDQDLVRTILREDARQRNKGSEYEKLGSWRLPTFTAIFCDESQDFTPVELSLLLKLSLFSHRSLRAHEIRKVPFVFAGDQFQTLNPTGFRWEAIKSAYVEKISLGLDGAQLEKDATVSLNYQELTFNYRSTREIVGFCNLVQALRTRVFSLTGEIKPQQTWSDASGNNVVLTNADREALWDSIRQFNVKVIIPCGEGEEVEFIKKDPILSRYVTFDDATGGTDVTVLSAASSKGLEFSHVLAYGFASETEAKKVIKSLSKPEEDPDASLPLQYFVNKLYVSVSRPTRCLVIAEKPDSVQDFWGFYEGESMKAIENGVKRWSEEWERHVTKPYTQLADFRFADGQVTDAVKDAEQLLAQAQTNRSPFMLRQAANLFKNAGKLQSYRACVAAAFEYEDKYKEAAEEYFASGDHFREAALAYLKAGLAENCAKIMTCGNKHPELREELEGRLARLVEGIQGKTNQDLGAAGKNLAAISANPRLEGLLNDDFASRSIRAALDRVLEHYLKIATNVPGAWTAFAKEYTKVRGKFADLTTPDCLALARLNHRAEQWTEGAKYYEQAKSTNSKEYLECKAKSASWPDNIEALGKLGFYSELVSHFDKFGISTLSPQQVAQVAGALAATERFDDAVTLVMKPVARHDAVAAALSKMPTRLSESRQLGLLALYFSKLGAEGDLQVLLACLKDIREFKIASAQEATLKVIGKNSDELMGFAVAAACMCSDAWEKIDWSPTSPFRKNRILQELKRAYPLGRTSALPRVLLAVGMVFEHLDAVPEAIEYYDKCIGLLQGDEKRLAGQRWVRCQLKRYHDLKGKNNPAASNEALRLAEEGFYTAQIKRGEEDTISQMPVPVDASWLLQPFIDKAHSGIQVIHSPQTSKPAGTTPAFSTDALTAGASLGNTMTPSSATVASSKLTVGGLELEHFPGKKVRILAPDGTGADYSFARGILVSTDDGVVGSDNLSIPVHGLVAQRLSDTSVQVAFATLKITIVFG